MSAMKLSQKGRYAPPPVLRPAAQSVLETIATWPGVHVRAHWLLGDERTVDGADFYSGEEEIGHIHLDSQAHVMQPKKVVEALIRAQLGRRFHFSDEVIVFDIRKQSDEAHALWLFQLSYDRCRGTKAAELLSRIAATADSSSSLPRARA